MTIITTYGLSGRLSIRLNELHDFVIETKIEAFRAGQRTNENSGSLKSAGGGMRSRATPPMRALRTRSACMSPSNIHQHIVHLHSFSRTPLARCCEKRNLTKTKQEDERKGQTNINDQINKAGASSASSTITSSAGSLKSSSGDERETFEVAS